MLVKSFYTLTMDFGKFNLNLNVMIVSTSKITSSQERYS